MVIIRSVSCSDKAHLTISAFMGEQVAPTGGWKIGLNP